jgi:hypothetical protein
MEVTEEFFYYIFHKQSGTLKYILKEGEKTANKHLTHSLATLHFFI